jgi:predicted transcriptional regulator
MPATKTKQYNFNEKQMAILGRAIAHPARVRILNLLRINGPLRNLEIANALRLSISTTHGHLQKLEDASLIKREFYLNSFFIRVNEEMDRSYILELKRVLPEC